MADEPPPRAPGLRIKLKLPKSAAICTVRLSGLPSSTSQDSKETKPGSALQVARLRQASLQGYVPPSASADAIVARLRDGEGFAPGAELPAWNFPAPVISSCEERPTKRARQLPCAEDRCPPSCQAPSATAGEICGHGHGWGPAQEEPAPDGKILLTKADAASGRLEATVGSGESNSDQATNSQVYLPVSPDDTGGVAARARATGGSAQLLSSITGQSSLETTCQPYLRPDALQQQRQRPEPPAGKTSAAACAPQSTASGSLQPKAPRAAGASIVRPMSTDACGPCLPSVGLTARGEMPSTSGRQQPYAGLKTPQAPLGVSVETQTSQREFPVLPLSFLELPRLCGTALSFKSIGPFDLQLEREQRSIGMSESRIDAHIEQAKRTKREGDKLWNDNGKLWTIKSLSKYLTAALMFMEAADAMLGREQRRDQRYNAKYAADLYRQTAELLVHTVTFADTIKGSGIGKEALRLLAERLCAICLLRQTSLMAGNFRACAERAQAALREHQRQQVAQASGAAAAAGPSGGGQQPSPEDSSTSSLHAVNASTGGGGVGTASAAGHGPAGSQPLAGFGHEQVSELLGYARTTLRFSEYMKRSSKSFEAFLERSDVRQDQQAKLVCMHLAALCMDVGMTPGLRVIYHAREAVRTMCEDLAR